MMNNTIMGFQVQQTDKYASQNNKSENKNNMDLISAKGRDDLYRKILETQDKRPEITERIQAARLQGGLEENEELLVALEDMQRVDMEVHRLQQMLEKVTVMDPLPKGKYNKVCFGTTVKIENCDTGKQIQYKIGGEFDSDPNNGTISFKSPLGAELIGTEKGDIVALMRPAGDIEYEVLRIFVP
jgi:transcription elongation factor GreA